MRNRHDRLRGAGGSKGDFTRHLTSNYPPARGRFIWHLSSAISHAADRRRVNWCAIFSLVNHRCRLRVRRVDQPNRDRVLSFIKIRRRRSNFLRCHAGLGTGVTWHISR